MPTSPASDLAPAAAARLAAPPPAPYGGRLMFTQSWEDPECDLAALRPRPGETILGVTSGGDNVLGFLLSGASQVIAVDLNPTQTWLLELKMAAFRRLTHAELLELLGVRRPAAARALYARLRGDLSPEGRTFFDAHLPWLDSGLLVAGGFERYFAMLRGALRWIVGRRRMARLFTLPRDRQREFYEREWNNLRWRALLRVVCSKWMLGRRLDPTWFEHADGIGSFGAHFTGLASHVIGDLDARSNYFLAQILLGRYVDEAEVPAYLRPEHFDTIRARLDRLRPVTADVGDLLARLPDRSVDAFALSNVFEYSPPGLFSRAKVELRRAARPLARFALRNLLAPRRLADDAAFVVDPDLGERLRLADRGFIYSHFEAATLRETQA
jgi:S-adenosylmethionine-diacylglycerol 3-amino-3-carboxypropyl transferase